MIYLMRHGQIEQSRPSRFVGQRDLALDATGREQARTMQRMLAPYDFTCIISSDLQRCQETARLAAQDRGLPIMTESALREISMGQWQGLTKDEVREQFAEEFETRGRHMAETRPSGGESYLDVAARVMPCFERIMAEDDGGTLVVAHSGVNRVIICGLLGLDLNRVSRLTQDYCCLNVIRPLEDGGGILERMNVTPPMGF